MKHLRSLSREIRVNSAWAAGPVLVLFLVNGPLTENHDCIHSDVLANTSPIHYYSISAMPFRHQHYCVHLRAMVESWVNCPCWGMVYPYIWIPIMGWMMIMDDHNPWSPCFDLCQVLRMFSGCISQNLMHGLKLRWAWRICCPRCLFGKWPGCTLRCSMAGKAGKKWIISFHLWLHCFECKSTEQKEAAVNLGKKVTQTKQIISELWQGLGHLALLDLSILRFMLALCKPYSRLTWYDDPCTHI